MTEERTESYLTTIDEEDAYLLEHAWWDGRYYRTTKDRIHRLIAERAFGKIPEGYVVDHIDRNPRNNSRENLRVVPQYVNVRNSDGKPSVRKSKFRGVFMSKGRWTAQITVEGVRRCLGTWDTEVEAAAAYKAVEALLFGLAGKP